MSKRIAIGVAAAAGLLWAIPARAASGDPLWTVEAGRTVGDGATVVWGTAGFPGVGVDLVHGIDPLTEIGGRVAFDYGQAGIVDHCCTSGLDFQFLLRRNLFDNGKIFIAGTFDPGIQLSFPTGATIFGISFPLGVQFGFPVSPVLTLSASFDLAMYVNFSNGFYPGYLAIPILFGGGLEYQLEKNLLLTFNLKLGPTIFTNTGASAQFTLYALAGIAYKF